MTAGPKPSVRPRKKSLRGHGELALIERIRSRADLGRADLVRANKSVRRSRELQLGIGDDCAILRPRPGEEIVVTTDMSLEGRHFRRDWHTPQSIGHRTLARGLSDLAAMGARPVAAFLSLALPRAVAQDTAWVDGFLDGLLELARTANVPLAGGDTGEAPGAEVLADIVLLGAVPHGRALRRDGARAGDRLFVTGKLGGAAAQLKEQIANTGRKRKKACQNDTKSPHFFPAPRLKTGLALLQRRLASAAIDVSDGLSTDLHHLCEASGICAEIEEKSLPQHPLLAEMGEKQAFSLMLHGGEDYELLFTAHPKTIIPKSLGGIPLTEIGQVLERGRGRPRVALINRSGRRVPLKPAGWEHLQ